jgi:hypothetical protein
VNSPHGHKNGKIALGMQSHRVSSAPALAICVLAGCALTQSSAQSLDAGLNQTAQYQLARDRGHAALEKKDYVTAERELRIALKLHPNEGQVCYWLGSATYGQRKVELIPEALFYFARAVVAEGSDALPDSERTSAEAYLSKAYFGFHGSDEGLDHLKEIARHNVTPPPDFKISTLDGAPASGADDPFNKTNPDIALWRRVRQAVLQNNGGVSYFEMVQGALFPPDNPGLPAMLRGTVVAQPSAQELLINVDSPEGDALLQFNTPIQTKMSPGDKVEFRGVIESYSRSPYLLTLRVKGSDLVIK